MAWALTSTVEIWNLQPVPRRGFRNRMVGELKQTSTGTIRSDWTLAETMMFGVVPSGVTRGLYRSSGPGTEGYETDSSFVANSMCATGSLDAEAYISRTSGEYDGSSTAAAGDQVQIWSRAVAGTKPFVQTCVPWQDVSDLDSLNCSPLVSVTYATDGSCSYSILDPTDALQQKAFGVIYKDPSVVYVGGAVNKWVMLVTRIRILSGSSAILPTTTSEGWTAGQTPGRSISDVVAFTSSDSLFSTAVEGPYWVVSDLDALPGVCARTWVGVPDGFYHEDAGVEYLYVYYMVMDLTGTSGLDTPDSGTNPGLTGTQRPCIAVRRVEIAEFNAAPLDPHDWESVVQNDPDYLMEGELLGEVQVWLAVPGGALGEVMAFADAFPNPILADPAVTNTTGIVTTEGATKMVTSLWFAAINRPGYSGGGDGYGVWRASAVDGGATLTAAGGAFLATFGLDFVARVDVDTTTGFYVDELARSDSAGLLVIDADPVELLDGTMRVYLGVFDSTTLTTDAMVVYEGDKATEIIAWTDAW